MKNNRDFSIPEVISWNGKVKYVKNLGWLRRHASEVGIVFLERNEDGSGFLTARPTTPKPWRYMVRVGSVDIMVAWFKRKPTFSHVKIVVMSAEQE